MNIDTTTTIPVKRESDSLATPMRTLKSVFVDARTFTTATACHHCSISNEGFLGESSRWIWSVDSVLCMPVGENTSDLTRIFNKGRPECFSCIQKHYVNLPKDLTAYLMYAPKVPLSSRYAELSRNSCIRCKCKILTDNRLLFKVSQYRDNAPWSWDGICDNCAISLLTKQKANEKLLPREIADLLDIDELTKILRLGWRIEGEGTRYYQD